MRQPQEHTTISLETLLKLKRSERPNREFWDSFDSSFERRRLSALVGRRSFVERIWSPAMKLLAFGAPLAAVITLSFYWSRLETPVSPSTTSLASVDPVRIAEVQRMENVRQDSAQPQKTGVANNSVTASNQFVLDIIEDNSSHRLNFRKVLYTPAIRLSAPSGSFYVKDTLSAHSYGVTTADLKLGQNF